MSEQSAARVAADSLGLHVLREIVDQFMQLPGFSNLTQAQQQVHLDRLDKTVRALIAEALGIMFSAEYPAVVATLGRISVGKQIGGSFDVERTAESRHELMDRSGQKVVIVMADPDRYYQRMTEVKARADQPDLFHDPDQPLGHMGVSEPPQQDEPPPDEGDSLDDALPTDDAGAPIDMVTPDSVWAALQAIGPRVEVFGEGLGMWTEEELQDAMVWAIAAKDMQESGRQLPPIPVSLFGRFSLFADETSPPPSEGPADSTASQPSNVDEKPEVVPREPIPQADDIVGITASLKERGIKVKGKEVARWSQSQRIAAVSWLAGRSSQRPDFLSAPPTKDEKGP
jgi:hypothetical protein